MKSNDYAKNTSHWTLAPLFIPRTRLNRERKMKNGTRKSISHYFIRDFSNSSTTSNNFLIEQDWKIEKKKNSQFLDHLNKCIYQFFCFAFYESEKRFGAISISYIISRSWLTILAARFVFIIYLYKINLDRLFNLFFFLFFFLFFSPFFILRSFFIDFHSL